MEIKEMYRVSFKSKHDDRGDYQICVSARNSDKALEKAMKQIEKNKDKLKDLTRDYLMLDEEIRALAVCWDYLQAHLPTVENIGFCIE